MFRTVHVDFLSAIKGYEEKYQVRITEPNEGETNRLMENSKGSQTTSTWKLQHQMEESEYHVTKKALRLTLQRQMKKRQDIVLKFKKTRNMLEKDVESKTKLLSSVKCKAMTVILDTKSLITQIQNSKATLERLKDQNQHYMEQYSDLAEQMKWDYNQLYGNVNDHEQAYVTNGYNHE